MKRIHSRHSPWRMETTVHRQGGRDIIIQRLALDPSDPVIPVKPPAVSIAQNPIPQEDGTAPILLPPAFLLMAIKLRPPTPMVTA